ncbi:MAG: hypothetical protein H6R18_294 [Proteobacteria bacterium]|nr:hypothetical protein [Pseudomonadota bacterium]
MPYFDSFQAKLIIGQHEARRLAGENRFGESLELLTQLQATLTDKRVQRGFSGAYTALAEIQTLRANIFRDQGQVKGSSGAYIQYLQAYKIFREFGNDYGCGEIALYLGACHEMTGALASAAGFYRLSIDALKNVSNADHLCAKAYLRMSTVFAKLREFSSAQLFFDAALSLAEKADVSGAQWSLILQKQALLKFDQKPEHAFDTLDAAEQLLPKHAALAMTQLYSTRALLLLRVGEDTAGLRAADIGMALATEHNFGHQLKRLISIVKSHNQWRCRPHYKGAFNHEIIPPSRICTDFFVADHLRSINRPAISEYLRAARSTISDSSCVPNLPYRHPRTLVLKGGGAKGLAFVGAISVLAKYYEFTSFVGTSAGAIAACLLGAGHDIERLEKVLSSTDFEKFMDSGLFAGLLRLVLRGGFYPGTYFTNWMEALLQERIASKTPLSMKNLPHRTILYASGWNSEGTVRFDSQGENAEVSATLAARASMSIPLIFQPVSLAGLILFDGGLLNNFPFEHQLNLEPDRELLGIYLSDGTKPARDVSSQYLGLLDVLRAFFDVVLRRDEQKIVTTHEDKIVIVDPSPIGTIDFALSSNQKKLLIWAGRRAAYEFLKGKGFNVDDLADQCPTKEALEQLRQSVIEFEGKRHRQQMMYRIAFMALLLATFIFLLY